ncbi:EamA family transporter [Desulfonatronum thiodismutans]|uniref:EamA family transporter n=1 Tax=Desulfonatronum thiodismutans TaxID=159290 RepID=UPI0004ABD641|nr:DMT family transporter [Desulfonatronum thiodismutans]
MLWAVLALGTAFFEAVKDALSKGQLILGDEYLLAWSYCVFALPLTGAYLWWEGIPAIGSDFGWALGAGVALNLVAVTLYMRAIKASELSLTLPMLTFTPLFMLITSPLILGEFPDRWGGLGMLLIISGAYLLNLRPTSTGLGANNEISLSAPFRALWNDPGPRVMLLVAFIWSFTANLDKVGVTNSSPAFWLFCFFMAMSIGLSPVVLIKSRRPVLRLRQNFRALFLVGLFGSLALVLQMWALTLTLAAYVVSIKRMSVVFGVVFGHVMFGEKDLTHKLLCATLMVAGVGLIALN